MIIKILKWIGLLFSGFLLVVTIVATMFLNMSPQFGGQATEEQQLKYAETGHYADGVFLNYEEIEMKTDCHSITKMIEEMFEPDPNVSPKQNIEVVSFSMDEVDLLPDSLTRITWLGHSSFLIEMDGMVILLDPIFSQFASPHQWFGRRRYNRTMPFELDDLPSVDAVIISHDHYDHLDYASIEKLKTKVKAFYVPLGVGNHLRSWDIEEDRIHELDWWDEDQMQSIRLAFVPSRHMSGRGLTDQSATLWGSWVLSGSQKNLYFSGDGGYGKHFKAIGDKYGPFDIGLMECGQYNKLWADVHMMPEQTVQAGIDVKARLIMPIHWGAFTLASHSWTDPIERVTRQAKELGMAITTPQIGESVTVGGKKFPSSKWWELVQ